MISFQRYLCSKISPLIFCSKNLHSMHSPGGIRFSVKKIGPMYWEYAEIWVPQNNKKMTILGHSISAYAHYMNIFFYRNSKTTRIIHWMSVFLQDGVEKYLEHQFGGKFFNINSLTERILSWPYQISGKKLQKR